MVLGQKLKEAREQSGYSQVYVADVLKVSRQAVSKWENGWTCPDIENIIMLSDLYGITIDELLKGVPGTEVNELQKEERVGVKEKDDLEDSNIENLMRKFDEEKKRNIELNDSFQIIMLAVITCLIPVIGVILNIGLIVYCKTKKKSASSLCKGIVLVCLIMNLVNAYIYINNAYLHSGKATIEKVAFLIIKILENGFSMSYMPNTFKVFCEMVDRTSVLRVNVKPSAFLLQYIYG